MLNDICLAFKLKINWVHLNRIALPSKRPSTNDPPRCADLSARNVPDI